MSSKFIAQMSSKNYRRWQMSSYHCRHCRNWADVLQTLPPKQMSSNATTTARISRIQNLITNDGFTYIQPLLLRAAGSLRQFPSCFHDPSPTERIGSVYKRVNLWNSFELRFSNPRLDLIRLSRVQWRPRNWDKFNVQGDEWQHKVKTVMGSRDELLLFPKSNSDQIMYSVEQKKSS